MPVKRVFLLAVGAAIVVAAPSAEAGLKSISAQQLDLQTDVRLAAEGHQGAAAGPSGEHGARLGAAPNADPDGPLPAIEAATQRAEAAIVRCGLRFDETHRCVAEALDQYASEIAYQAPSLPPRLQDLPTIVRRAAQGVREAGSRAQAIHALRLATAAVNKTIALLRAEDPNALSLGAKVARSVDETFGVAEEELVRSSEL